MSKNEGAPYTTSASSAGPKISVTVLRLVGTVLRYVILWKMCLSACCARGVGSWLRSFCEKELKENIADRGDHCGSSAGLVPLAVRVAALTKCSLESRSGSGITPASFRHRECITWSCGI